MTSPVPDALRTQLAQEATRHHMVIGVDQRLVMCTCGWSSTDEANLRRPVAPFGAHVAEALLPFLARARAEGAAEALRDLADTPRESPWDPPWQAVADPLFNATLRNLADQYEALTKETPDA